MTVERKSICFRPPEGFETESLFEDNGLSVKPGKTQKRRVRRIFYDTFEWQLLANNAAAIQENRLLSLYNLDTGLPFASVGHSATARFFHPFELKDEKFRSEIERYTELRALIKRCTVEVDIVSQQLLDEEEKTIAILNRETYFLFKEKKSRILITENLAITPLKGFQEETETFASGTGKLLGREHRTRYRDLFMQFMDAAGVPVNDYSSKIRITLQPGDPVQKSAASLLLGTLDIMKRNEPWIPENIDTEFLHDYRVAVRRTRSVLGTIRDIFDSGTTARYRNAFRNAGKACNALRDCDVYLLRESDYRAMLPESLAPHIAAFFNELHELHRIELRRFSSFLRSKAYRAMLDEWNGLLGETERNPVPVATQDTEDRSTLAVAKKNIRKAWKKVLRHGRAIPAQASDAELHSLRIDCKKLRYLLELFASLFPDKTMATVVRQLKELQENLGMFVDLAVQQQYLAGHIEQMKEKPSDPELAAALGGLITTLHCRQEKTRKLFHRTFRHFDNDETETLFNALLNS